jgi:hypothetical protein
MQLTSSQLGSPCYSCRCGPPCNHRTNLMTPPLPPLRLSRAKSRSGPILCPAASVVATVFSNCPAYIFLLSFLFLLFLFTCSSRTPCLLNVCFLCTLPHVHVHCTSSSCTSCLMYSVYLCLLYILPPVHPAASCTSCLMYILPPVHTASCTSCLLYTDASCTSWLMYILPHVYPA